MKGSYVLLIHLTGSVSLTVGRLGRFYFPAGYYIYFGSALGGLEARIGRHLRQHKKTHWHIDWLTAVGNLVQVWWTEDVRPGLGGSEHTRPRLRFLGLPLSLASGARDHQETGGSAKAFVVARAQRQAGPSLPYPLEGILRIWLYSVRRVFHDLWRRVSELGT